MRRSLLIVVAASALTFSTGSLAQTASPAGTPDSAPPAGPATTPPSADPGPVNPPTAAPGPTTPADPSSTMPPGMPSAATAAPAATASGAPTSATVAERPPAATGMVTRGMTVRDSAGQSIGRIARLDTSTNATGVVIHMRRGGDVTVPLSTLHVEGNGAVSSQSRAEIQPAAAAN